MLVVTEQEAWHSATSGCDLGLCEVLHQYPKAGELPTMSALVVPSLRGSCCGSICGAYLQRLCEGNSGDAEQSNIEYVFKPFKDDPSDLPELKRGIEFGDAIYKETAAYLVDHFSFAGVPVTHTGMVKFRLSSTQHTTLELGSLQEHIQYECSAEDISSCTFDRDDVHSIGLLDCRIFNLDRSERSILLQRGASTKMRLVPIDHGLSMPSWDKLSGACFCWSSWKLAAEPFSEAMRIYVAALEPFKDVTTLLKLGIRPDCVLTYLICSLFVKKAVAEGLRLCDIAATMQSGNDSCHQECSSVLEKIVSTVAKESGFNGFGLEGVINWDDAHLSNFLRCFSQAASRHICSVKLDLST